MAGSSVRRWWSGVMIRRGAAASSRRARSRHLAPAVILRLPRKCLVFSNETTWFKALHKLDGAGGSTTRVCRRYSPDEGLGLSPALAAVALSLGLSLSLPAV